MAYASGSTITCIVHGDSCPYSGARHDPTIKLKFTATISRENGVVKAKLSSMKFWVTGPGGYGYKLSVYARLTTGSSTSATWTKLDKSTATTNTKWTRTPSAKTISCTTNATTVYIQIGAYSSDKKQCYGSSTKRITAYAFSAPPPNYTITYNANGGTDAPEAQVIPFATPTTTLLGDDTHPIYPVDVKYWDDGPAPDHQPTKNETPQPEREFLSWNTKADGTGTDYARNAEYTATGNVTMYAKWGNAEFECDTPTVQSYNVTFVPNNGASDIVKAFGRSSEYNTDPSGSGTTYIPYEISHTMSVTTTPLDLYPIYGNAVLLETDLVVPPDIVKPGYAFDCWCTDSALQTPLVIPAGGYVLTQDIPLYARWLPLPVYQKTNGEWKSIEPQVWKCVMVNGEKQWQRIAHVFRCVKENGVKYWKDIST